MDNGKERDGGSPFQSNGEILHAASSDLLQFQLQALTQDEAAAYMGHHAFTSSVGSVLVSHDFKTGDDFDIKHTVELFKPDPKDEMLPSVGELVLSSEEPLKWTETENWWTLIGAADEEITIERSEGLKEESDFCTASGEEIQQIVKHLDDILSPTLHTRDMDWLNTYAALLGASIHEQDPTSELGKQLIEKRDYASGLFIGKLENRYHFYNSYQNRQKIMRPKWAEDVSSGNPNLIELAMDELIDFDATKIFDLEPTDRYLAVYDGVTFLKPGESFQGLRFSFGAYLDVTVLPARRLNGETPKRIGSILFDNTVIKRTQGSFN